MSIGPLKPNYKVVPIATADIETDHWGALLNINLAYRYHGELVYKTCETWLEWFDCLKEAISCGVTCVWFHNMGRFDGVPLLKDLLEGKYTKEVSKYSNLLVNGSIMTIKMLFSDMKKFISIADSYKLMPTPLAALTGPKGFNLKHGKGTIPKKYLNHMEVYREKYPNAYHSYHKQDTIALLEVLEAFHKLVNSIAAIGPLPLSLGSLAMKVFRTGFLDYEIFTPGIHEREFTRPAYVGGRTEFGGDGVSDHPRRFNGVNCYDVNSHYPAAMQNNLYPVRPGAYIDDEAPAYSNGQLNPGIFRITYTQRHGKIAIMKPLIDGKRSPEALFSGTGFATHIEINEILSNGGEVKIHEGYIYSPDHMKPIFTKFVAELYKQRLLADTNGNAAMKYVIKLLMNNLYGKFGQGETGQTVVILSFDEVQANITSDEPYDLEPYPELGPDAYLKTERYRCEHRFPTIAAFITAHARLTLLYPANHRGIRFIYCDTDSVHTQDTMPADLVHPTRLGAFKLEKSRHSIVYGGRKVYADLTIRVSKCKGAPSESINFDYFSKCLLLGLPFVSNFESPTGIKMAIKKNCPNPNQFLPHFRTIVVDRSSMQKGLIR